MKKIIAIIFMVFITSFGVTKAEEYVYEPTVLTFTGNTHPNPYTDVIFWTVFTGPNSEELVLIGFWDGGTTWKIRFTPTAAGTWTYTTGALGDSLLSGKTGQIIALESTSKGFIIRDPNNDFAFKRSRGNNIFLMGDTCWNCMSTSGGTTKSVWADYVDIRKSQNFNFIRSYIVSLYVSGKCPGHPYCDPNKNEGGWAFGDDMNPDTLNPAYFQGVEERIEYANSKDVSVFLTFGSDRQAMTNFFNTDKRLKRYIRYVVARFGGYDVAWDGRLEFEEQNLADIEEAKALANKIGNWVEEYDPYAHLQSMHTLDSCNELGNEGWLDWIMHQGFEGNTHNYSWDLITSDRSYGKPVMNIEFYYEESEPGAGTHPHHADADTLRKGAWHSMLNGASGLAYGHTGTLDAAGMYFQGVAHTTSPGADYMTNLYNFFSYFGPWKFSPALPSATNDLLSNPGSEYIASFEQGGSRTISVSPGCYIYNWYNPRAGTTEAGGSFSGSSYNFVPPDNNDWVLACVKDADACEPGNSDADGDGVPNDIDNCPEHYNPWQIDTYPPQGNGIGNACDCEGDFNCDGNVAADDVTDFLANFGRNFRNIPCTNLAPCNGDLNCDQNVAADDLSKFLEDFGRNLANNPCPPCEAGVWCY